jgi:CBS domain-containing membrane protein
MVEKEVKALDLPESIDLTEADVLEAMQEIPGYLDITPRDFKEIYNHAYRRALSRLLREITAVMIMTRDVVVVSEDTPLAEVAAAMGEHGISGVPVVDRNGRVTGIISEKDFLTGMGVTGPQNFMTLVANCLAIKGCVALPIKKQTARDIMTAPPITVTPDTNIKEIAVLFTSRKVNRVPVVDNDGKILGIVTRANLLHATCHGERP